jgi:hypothetical protein
LDAAWTLAHADPIPLRIIGSTALFLQSDYERGTKDSDIIQTLELAPEIATELRSLAGERTALHERHRIYLDLVGSGVPFLPFLPHPPQWLPIDLRLSHFELSVLDVVDVVVSKLKPFRQSDVDDIEAMIDRDLVAHDMLVARFKSAVDYFTWDARAETGLPQYIANLNVVERDLLGVDETEIELPRWL